MDLCDRRLARRSERSDRRGVHKVRLRDHAADGNAAKRTDFVLRADRTPSGTRRLPGKLAADADGGSASERSAGDGRPRYESAGRRRNLGRRVLHYAGRRLFLGIVATTARYRYGNTRGYAEPFRIRI